MNAANPTSHKAPRVLVVDDERTVRMLLRVVLEGAGMEVVEAADGAQALRLAALSPDPFDCVVTDLQMPVFDGSQLVVALRARFGAQLPMIVQTARPDLARDLLAGPGIQGILGKPFVPGELVELVERCVHPAPHVDVLAG
jgi:two-component system chemotaxis response regulator CheY